MDGRPPLTVDLDTENIWTMSLGKHRACLGGEDGAGVAEVLPVQVLVARSLARRVVEPSREWTAPGGGPRH